MEPKYEQLNVLCTNYMPDVTLNSLHAISFDPHKQFLR